MLEWPEVFSWEDLGPRGVRLKWKWRGGSANGIIGLGDSDVVQSRKSGFRAVQ